MRILGYMVVRNEEHRYLEACLKWNMPWLDDIAIYDDCSDDDTVDVAFAAGAKVRVRSEGIPSFMEHEGKFRQAAWGWFEHALQPTADDWVFGLDADEFLLLGSMLKTKVSEAHQSPGLSMCVAIPEVFQVEEQDGLLVNPQVRKDGFWSSITNNRIFRWQPGATFANRLMGCGAQPIYAVDGPMWKDRQQFDLLHYGYAHPDDRRQKFERYSTLNNAGHSARHVQSILQEPELDPWDREVPLVWRGTRAG